STSPNSASSTAFRPNGISAWIIASVTGVVTVPSSNGSAAWPPPIGDCWFFRVCSRTLGMGGVLGTEWKSLAGFTLLYRGTTCFSTTTGTHPAVARPLTSGPGLHSCVCPCSRRWPSEGKQWGAGGRVQLDRDHRSIQE